MTDGRVLYGRREVEDRTSRRPLELRMPTGLTIHFDGGRQDNGERYGSYDVKQGGELLFKARRVLLGTGTSNEAEYLALKSSLEHLVGELGIATKQVSLSIFSDSKLVVNQVNGTWKIKNERMRKLCVETQDLLNRFLAWRLSWNSRNVNLNKFGH